MKKFLFIILSIIFFASCDKSNEVDLIIGNPDERISDTLDLVKSTLVGAPDGWIAYTTTDLSGGYGFYMDFSTDDRVSMIADLTETAAQEAKESTYRIRQIMSATLVFDTYNYITMLQDPTPSTYGGTAGKGTGSDVEYEYRKLAGDTIFFQGRRFKKDLVLVKASSDQKNAYLGGGYLTAINKFRNFFNETPNAYIEINGNKIALSTIHSEKTVSTTYLIDNKVEGSTEKFYYTLNGIGITPSLSAEGINIVELKFEGNDLYAIDTEGNKHKIQSSPSPLLPLYMLMGAKYGGMWSPYLTYFPGTSDKGLTILKRYHEGLGNRATGYTFNSGYIDLEWNVVNKRISIMGFSSQNGGASGWTTTYVYDYVLDEATGIYTLTYRSGPSGGYTSAILDQLLAFFNNSRIKLDYYTEGGNLYGQIIGVDDPDVVISMELW